MAWLFRRLGSLESLGNIRESSLISLISLNSLLNRVCSLNFEFGIPAHFPAKGGLVRCGEKQKKQQNRPAGQFCVLNLTIC